MYINDSLGLSWEDAEAAQNALKKCGILYMIETDESAEFLSYFVDWYFSGNGWKHAEDAPEVPEIDSSDEHIDHLHHLEKEEKLCTK